jgi:hypothetical protein
VVLVDLVVVKAVEEELRVDRAQQVLEYNHLAHKVFFLHFLHKVDFLADVAQMQPHHIMDQVVAALVVLVEMETVVDLDWEV